MASRLPSLPASQNPSLYQYASYAPRLPPRLFFQQKEFTGFSLLQDRWQSDHVKALTQFGPVQMTLVEERHVASRTGAKPSSTNVLAYELVQGALVRWSEVMDRATREPPTAVFLHGILGARRNWASFAKRLAQEFPNWQFLLVDLRCHGDSSSIPKRGPHTVASAAQDVLRLVGQLKLTPRVLIGHSFGGKVALSMVEQAAKPLARPVQVWVLDATPGTVQAGGNGEDHPAKLIEALTQMPKQVSSRRFVINELSRKGFSAGIAQWMTTNLRPVGVANGSSAALSWIFDLQGISDMYQSYEITNLWHLVENVPQGVHCNFLRAARSLHRWAHEDVQRIHMAESLAASEGAGVQMHVLEDAGHWVHTDNPDGLFRILAPSFLGYEFSNRMGSTLSKSNLQIFF